MKKYLLLSLLTASFFFAKASDYYWVGGSGNWSDFATHWATTSGGSTFKIQIPQSTDNVIFDANSFSSVSQTVTLDVTSPTCNDMTWTGVVNAPTLNGNSKTLKVYGSLTLVPGMTVNSFNPSFESTATGKTITSAGKTLGNLTLNGIGGGWTLQDVLTVGTINLNYGSFSTNNQTITAVTFSSDNANVRSLTLGSSVINLSNGAGAWYLYTTTNMTFSSGTSTINFTGTGGNGQQMYSAGNLVYNNLNFTGANAGIYQGPITANAVVFSGNCKAFAGANTITSLSVTGTFAQGSGGDGGAASTITTATFGGSSNIRSSNTFGTINLTGVGATYTFTNGTTQTINTALNIAGGTGSNPIFLNSNSVGSQATISMASGSVCTDYIRTTDINVTGGATFTAGPSSQNISNTTGWTFMSGVSPTVSITASTATTICAGTSVTFTATPTNAGITPSYQWRVNGSDVGTNSASYTSTALSNSDAVTVVLTSIATPCNLLATSNTVTVTVNPTSVAGTASGTTSIVSGSSTTISLASQTGNIQWQSSANGTDGWADMSGATATSLTTGALTVTVYYRAAVTIGLCNPAISNVVTVTVTAAGSANADLSALAISLGTLSPTFAAGTIAYTASVTNATTSVTVTPTRAEANATIEVRVNAGGYSAVTSGSPSSAQSLNIGANTIDVRVTAQDGTTKTYTVTVTRTMLPPGNALHFDGSDDNVNINSTIGNFGTGAFTIETWVRTTATTGTIISKRDANSHGNFFVVSLNDGKIVLEINATDFADYTGATSPAAINDGRWHHIAAKRSSDGNLHLLIDGVVVTVVSVNGNPNISNSVTTTIGRAFDGVTPLAHFNGTLDKMRIWNVGRTDVELQGNMFNSISSATGLLASFNFDAGTAGSTNTGITTLTDQTSNLNNGSLNNFALTGTTSNWVESYAMVVPTATAATSVSPTGLTANWVAPAIGTLDNAYRLDVSTSSTFVSFVTGYNGLTVAGTSQSVTGLTGNTTYYYRVSADKTSVTGQGGYSASITTTTVASTNADLSALTTTAGTITQTFDASIIAYTASVTNAITSVTVTPTRAEANATIQVRVNAGIYATVTSGSASGALSLNLGSNAIDIRVTAQDGTTIKTYTITVTRENTLPVSFISFDAKQNNTGSVDLTWLTASESNNSHFMVLKSTDGVSFAQLAKISGSGNSNQQNRYQTADKNPANGNNYYQLVQFDTDGKATVLATKVVNVALKNSNEVSVYPNPAQEAVNIKFEAGVYNIAKLIDLKGSVLASKSIDAKQALTSFNIGNLPAGNYFIVLEGKTGSVSKSVIKN